MSKKEKRAAPRYPARLPATIRFPSGGGVTVETRDLSTHGAFFFTPAKLESGSQIEIILMMPAEVTGNGAHWVCCRGEIVRVEESGEGRFGIAAELHEVQSLPEI